MPLAHESVENALHLTELDLFTLGKMADELRREECGDVVTFVVNRNINFTNICIGGCKFCAFTRMKKYVLSIEQILEKADEAWR